MLYITSLWLTCFITRSLYLSISLTYFIHPPTSLPYGNHQFVLCIYESVLIYLFICFIC